MNFDEQIVAYHKREVSAGHFGSRAFVNCLPVTSCTHLPFVLSCYLLIKIHDVTEQHGAIVIDLCVGGVGRFSARAVVYMLVPVGSDRLWLSKSHPLSLRALKTKLAKEYPKVVAGESVYQLGICTRTVKK